MASEVVGLALATALAVVGAWPTSAKAADPNSPRAMIFRCTDASGKKITSDRPVRECANSPHDELNPDGSLKRVVPPPMTDDERAESEQRDRDAKVVISTKNDWIRRDHNLLQRYPDETRHNEARKKALGELNLSVQNYQKRIELLTAERTKLLEDAEFYLPLKKPLPTQLKLRMDSNEVSLKVQNGLVQDQVGEVARINANYEIELVRLKKLWAGAPAGSLGPLPQAAAASDVLKATTAK